MSTASTRSSRACLALFERRMHTAAQYMQRASSCDELGDVASAEYCRSRADEIAAIAHRDHDEAAR